MASIGEEKIQRLYGFENKIKKKKHGNCDFVLMIGENGIYTTLSLNEMVDDW